MSEHIGAVKRCELVDRLFLVKRVGVDGKVTQSSTVQIRSFTKHRGSKWLNLLMLVNSKYYQIILRHPWTGIKAP